MISQNCSIDERALCWVRWISGDYAHLERRNNKSCPESAQINPRTMPHFTSLHSSKTVLLKHRQKKEKNGVGLEATSNVNGQSEQKIMGELWSSKTTVWVFFLQILWHFCEHPAQLIFLFFFNLLSLSSIMSNLSELVKNLVWCWM